MSVTVQKRNILARDSQIEYIYDAFGRLFQKREHAGNDILIHTTLYDPLDQVIEERLENEAGRLFRKTNYAYDVEGNRISVLVHTDEGGSLTQTLYDVHGQPLIVIDALGNTTRYRYLDDYINTAL